MHSPRFSPYPLALAVLLGVTSAATLVAAPNISATSPGSVRPGQKTTLVVRGGGLADVTNLWASFPAESVVDPNRRSGNEVAFDVTVPADVSPGINAIRVVGPSGVSALKLFVVDDLPCVDRVGGNDSLDKAQPLELPTAVSGHVDGLKSHFFRFRANAGQKLTFEVFARRIGSPLDPMIRLLTSSGSEITYSDDEPGLTGDSRLRHEFSETGEYVLELRDITYKGGGGHRFHLRIGEFPEVDVPYPLEAKRGSTVDVAFAGPSADAVAHVKVAVRDDPSLVSTNVAARFAHGTGPAAFATLAVSATEQAIEVEPNNDLKTATNVAYGATFHGRLGEPGDVDYFRVTAKKGDARVLRAVTRSQGAATDVVLRVLDAGGKQLSNVDDTGTADATITFNPPADGEYVVAVTDLIHRGGPSFAYRITSESPSNGFTLSLAADHVNVPDTGVGAITVNVARGNHKGPVEITAVDLPAGLESGTTIVGPGLNSGVLTIRSKGHAQGTIVPLKVVGRATIGGKPFETTATTSEAVKAAHAAMPYPPPSLSEAAVLTVTPPPPFTLAVSQPEVVFGKQLSGKVKVVATRSEGFDGDIALAVELDKVGVPPNVAPALKPIKKGTSEIEIAFNANQNAPLGRFTTVVRGTANKVTQYTPAITLQLRKPFTPTVTPGGGTIPKGGQLKLVVALARNPALGSPIQLQVDNLPAGVKLTSGGEPSAEGTLTLVLTADADAKPVEAKNVTVTGVATVGKAKLTEKSAAFTIKVD